MQCLSLRQLTRTLLLLGMALLAGTSYSVAADAQLPGGFTAIQTALPEFVAPSVHGTTVRSVDWQGKVTVLRFWASW